MKTRIFLTFLGFAYLLNTVDSKCDLTGRKDDVAFPDILKYVAESYIMGVEYTVPGATQTDYYTEYYDNIFKRGRVDSHIGGENKQYIYRSETWEAWVLEKRKCDLQNLTVVPDFFKDDQTDWMHFSGSEFPTTIGPSAMFKIAYDVWSNPSKDTKKMAYMGKLEGTIRGESAVFWRRCLDGDGYADYFFADETAENPYDTNAFDKVVTPLRVSFYGLTGEDKAMSEQSYDILSFQHLIPAGVEPFELPKGRNCQRGVLADGPKKPDFSLNSILLYSEVVYQRFSTADDEYVLMSSYYSTLMFALDRGINHLAYYYSSWNTTKKDKEHEEPFLNAPNYIIYDTKHEYKYNVSYATDKCDISRSKEFSPQYKLPENGGSIALDDPYVFFPNNEFFYLTTGSDRGLPVNIFETQIEGYVLDKGTQVDKVIATHSYRKENEQTENTVEVTSAPTQIQLRLYRKDNTEEVLTFNIFGFTTRIDFKQYIFDIRRCFKNDDDYSFLTIGYEVPPAYMPEMPKKLGELEENLVNQITLKSELNAVRIPKIMTDIKDNYVYATLLILGKPPLMLDFNPKEENKMIVVNDETKDTQGISNFDTCANICLEGERFDCWGFSLCKATCYFGSGSNTEVQEKADCDLYRRYTNETGLQSKELQINNIVSQIKSETFRTEITLDSGDRVELQATVAEVTDPAEDEELFNKMGNMLNPRMRVFKAATKLKKEVKVKNLGKLRYDECQTLCLDFKDCETISYCLIDGKCVLSNTYGKDLKAEEMEADQLCMLLARKYTDHFERVPGISLNIGGGTEKTAVDVEDCARACLQDDKCLSFDHCAEPDKPNGCTLYSTHYLSPKSRKDVQKKSPSCGHFSRKFSRDFTRKDETRLIGSKIPPIMNLTLEECAKSCIDYGQGTCYGYDFCQTLTLYGTTCTLFDTDPSRMQSTYSSICTNYVRAGAEYAPRPFTNSYAGGIGFLCFLIGSVVGVIVVFAIAYFRVNRQ